MLDEKFEFKLLPTSSNTIFFFFFQTQMHPTSEMLHVGWNVGCIREASNFTKTEKKKKKNLVGWSLNSVNFHSTFIQHSN